MKSKILTKDLEKTRKVIVKTLKKYGIKKAGIFGSYVRGENKKNSDIDILIEAPKGFSLFNLVALERELMESLGRKVDILTYKGIYHLLKNRILKE